MPTRSLRVYSRPPGNRSAGEQIGKCPRRLATQPRGTIVATGNIELNENMELASPLSSPPPGARGTSYLGRRRFSCLQIASHAPSDRKSTRLNSSHLGISYA